MKRAMKQLLALVMLTVLLAGLSSMLSALSTRAATPRPDSVTVASLTAQLDDARQQLKRMHAILAFADRYDIPASLSTRIYDNAALAGIAPAIGYQLVNVESHFQDGARSSAAAIGLTQLRVGTARTYDASIDAEDLMNPDTNLRLGFRYLRDLIDRFGNDVPVALEAYNKGPSFITAQQDSGEVLTGSYAHAVMRGVRHTD